MERQNNIPPKQSLLMGPIKKHHRGPVHPAMHIRDKRHDREPRNCRLKRAHVFLIGIDKPTDPQEA